mmetsp:Transcript_8829/g.15031  ORF Transcript_8829/g.15031 Transcript_8829/m.15031 type:complete len:749 (-) Transcript_8829:311-2557(-)
MSDCDSEHDHHERSCADDFDIINRIGSGSFGTVFRVRRKQDGNIYVIKNVRISELSKKEQLEAINEVDLLAKMDSPFVVKYLDSFLDKNCLQIVMEFCNKGDLQRMVKRAVKKELKSLGEKSTWNIILQILLGLHYLHNMKVLHRDMKSANVFLMKYPNQNFYCVKIGDLGVAKLLDTSTAFAQSLVGTPYYLSPELCADLPYRDKSDVWAFGVILYESCMLTHPFDARNQCALIMKIVQAQMAPIADHVPPELANLITWALQKDPKDRPKIKHILNDRYVREKLAEHHLEVPLELAGDKLTNRIAVDPPTIEAGHHHQHQQTPPQPTKARATSSSSTSSSSSSGSTSASSRGPGGRVRGRVDGKIVSSKARERYQVKPPTVPPRRGSRGISTEEERNMVDALQAVTVANSKNSEGSSSRRGSKHESEDEPSWNDAKLMLAEIAANDKVDAAALTLQEGGLGSVHTDRGNEQDQEDDNEEDENDHDVDEEADAKEDDCSNSLEYSRTHRRVSESKEHVRGGFDVGNSEYDALGGTTKIKYTHNNDTTLVHKIEIDNDEEVEEEKSEFLKSKRGDNAKSMLYDDDEDDEESTLAGGNTMMREEDDLWKTAWSQGRGVLNSERGGVVEDEADASLPEAERSSMRKRRARMLEGLIEDSKNRNISRIGEHVFNRIYELMSTIMYAPVSENATADLAALSATVSEQELMELERTLCDTLEGGVQEACEVVFDIKKLLAIESSLDNMKESHRK